ncbi:hypothetical protein MCG98_03385 [Ruminococcus sp. OA3]|uniref:hypothetical protein n=1 Tax=Ruminococcus sp. OA3 TaxID=2914164 RepID=UPI001F061501|nr:hypothetical protein [Ruminococcus sp. OA3]MCH1981612.1 hypothetical protein [Ruminococcus sp. OA3]
MHKKHTAWTQSRKMPGINPGIKPETELFNMIYAIGSEMGTNPQIFLSGKDTLWVYYEFTCYSSELFFDEYGASMALVSEKYPVSVYGTVNESESGELIARMSQYKAEMEWIKKDISSGDFDEMLNICVKIKTPAEDIQKEFYRILCDMDYRNELLAVRRTYFLEHVFADYPQYNQDTYFRYIPMAGDWKRTSCTASLTVSQKKELWMLFLQERYSPIEFDEVWKLMEDEQRLTMFSWEMALRLALDQLGVRILYDEKNGFAVINGENKRMYYNYDSDSTAERLFLKLLFPRPYIKKGGPNG